MERAAFRRPILAKNFIAFSEAAQEQHLKQATRPPEGCAIHTNSTMASYHLCKHSTRIIKKSWRVALTKNKRECSEMHWVLQKNARTDLKTMIVLTGDSGIMEEFWRSRKPAIQHDADGYRLKMAYTEIYYA